ncbi:MAG TPA: hypothetical protein VLX61_08345, partial [Anaerolineales bacterium]|nr:hypothetical protein [Anaerolineales bacterium]
DLELLEDRQEKLQKLLPEMIELGRMRSDFALEHFVVGMHDMPGRQRAQALAELQAMYFSLGELYDDIRLTELDLKENDRKTERQRIQAEGLERKLLSLSINLRQRIKEVDCLIKLLGKMPEYTAEQLENEEKIYWATRLTRQAYLMPRDAGGNLDALLQFITEAGKDKPVVPVGPHQFLLGLGLDAEAVVGQLEKMNLISPAAAKLLVAETKPKEPRKRHPGKG